GRIVPLVARCAPGYWARARGPAGGLSPREPLHSLHRYQLLGNGWMDRHRVVEILLGCTHAYGHCKTLQQLVGAETDDVTTHNAALAAVRDQLHPHARLAPRERVIERNKRSLENLDLPAETTARLGFGKTNGANGRMAEDHGGNPRIVQMALGLAAKQSISQSAPGGDRDRGKRF